MPESSEAGIGGVQPTSVAPEKNVLFGIYTHKSGEAPESGTTWFEISTQARETAKESGADSALRELADKIDVLTETVAKQGEMIEQLTNKSEDQKDVIPIVDVVSDDTPLVEGTKKRNRQPKKETTPEAVASAGGSLPPNPPEKPVAAAGGGIPPEPPHTPPHHNENGNGTIPPEITSNTILQILESGRSEAGLEATNLFLDPRFLKLVALAASGLQNAGKTEDSEKLQSDARAIALEQFKQAHPEAYDAYMRYGVNLDNEGNPDFNADLAVQETNKDIEGRLAEIAKANPDMGQQAIVDSLRATNEAWQSFMNKYPEKVQLFGPQIPTPSQENGPLPPIAPEVVHVSRPEAPGPNEAGATVVEPISDRETVEANATVSKEKEKTDTELLREQVDQLTQIVAKLAEDKMTPDEVKKIPGMSTKDILALLFKLVVGGVGMSAMNGVKAGMAESAPQRG